MTRRHGYVLLAITGIIVLALSVTYAVMNRSAPNEGDKTATIDSTSAPTAEAPLPNWPDADNTGVDVGVNLTEYSEPCTITTAATITGVDARPCGALVIKAKEVVITNSLMPVIDATDPNGSVNISDSTIQAGKWSEGAVWGFNITATRLNITGGQHSVHCNDNCTVTDSWLHDQYNAPGDSYHNNAFISNGGSNVVLRHNTLHCTAILNPTGGGCTADLSLFGDFSPITNVVVENNLFKANSNSISYCAFGGYEPSKTHPVATGVKFIDNVFERGTNGKCGVWGPVTSFQATANGNLWSGNVFDDHVAIEP